MQLHVQYITNLFFPVLSKLFCCVWLQLGTVTCKRVDCPHTNCAVPRRIPGQCCSVCEPSEDCYYGGQRYDDGYVFTSLDNECEDCYCKRGEVQCSARPCQTVSCKNPATDKCCPLCHDCHYGNKLYRHDEKFISRDDAVCQNCQCRVRVNCVNVSFYYNKSTRQSEMTDPRSI